MLRTCLLLLLAAPLAHAQSAFDLPNLYSSPQEAETAGAATLSPTGAPAEGLLNPALLAGPQGLRASYGGTREWLGLEGTKTSTASFAYGGESTLGGLPLAVGAALTRQELRFEGIPRTNPEGPDPTTLESDDVVETAYGLGLAARWDGPVRLAVGATGFARRSPLPEELDVDNTDPDRALTVDLGALLAVPVLRANPEPRAISVPIEVVAGGVRRHMEFWGDYPERAVDGGDVFQSRPLPETGALGGGVDLAIARGLGGDAFEIASLDIRVEREWDGLDRSRRSSTDGFRGAADFTLFETLGSRSGVLWTDGANQTDRVGNGLSFHVDGLLRAIGTFTDNESLRQTGEQFGLRFDLTVYEVAEDRDRVFGETFFGGVALSWRP